MFRAFLAAVLIVGGIMLITNVRGNKNSAPAPLAPLQKKTMMTGELTEDHGIGLENAEPEENSNEAASTLAAIEYFIRNRRLDSLENLFENEKLPATAKAALIDAALELDDPRLIARAESLALKVIDEGEAAEVLAVLPKVPQFPENSRVHDLSQESLCRFSGFGFEVLKLKYDRTFPHGRPWDAVCKTS